MAFLHLLNCVLLAFAPVFVIFNSTSLQEYGAKVCIGGLLGGIGSAMVKLIAYASLVPVTEEWSLISEFIKESISIIDILAIQYVFTWKNSRIADKNTRILGVGLGWGTAELLLSHLLVFLFNAGGGEFTWVYLQRAINANCGLFQSIILSFLVYVTIKGSKVSKLLSIIIIALQIIIRPLTFTSLLSAGFIDSWTSVAAQLVWTLALVVFGGVFIAVTN
jgi:Predicted membrane protein (DUF2053)